MFLGARPQLALDTSRTETVPADEKGHTHSFSPVFKEGEVLKYEVSYLGIKLGSIISRCIDIDSGTGAGRYRTECLIRSYDGVPFVTLHTLFQSTMDDSISSISFSTTEKIKDTTHKYINYTYAPKRDVVWISERIGRKPVPQNYDTLTLDKKRWQDGLSLLFYARAHAQRRYTDRVPVLIYRSKALTTINFGRSEEHKDIDAVTYPVRTVKIDGETGFTGIFGLTGGFEGWFSKDAAAIPIYAKMHVLIGSVALELVEWKRAGWSPPR